MKCWHVTFEVEVSHSIKILITDEETEANAVRRATEKALNLCAYGKLGRVLSVEAT